MHAELQLQPYKKESTYNAFRENIHTEYAHSKLIIQILTDTFMPWAIGRGKTKMH